MDKLLHNPKSFFAAIILSMITVSGGSLGLGHFSNKDTNIEIVEIKGNQTQTIDLLIEIRDLLKEERDIKFSERLTKIETILEMEDR